MKLDDISGDIGTRKAARESLSLRIRKAVWLRFLSSLVVLASIGAFLVIARGVNLFVVGCSVGVLLLLELIHREYRKLETLTASEQLALDSRPFFVFVRAFERDQELVKPPAIHRPETSRASIAMAISQVFSPLGPVIGLGDPTPRNNEPGLSVDIEGQATWKERICKELQRASLVLCLIDERPSPNLWLEVEETCLRHGAKTVFLFFPHAPETRLGRVLRAVGLLPPTNPILEEDRCGLDQIWERIRGINPELGLPCLAPGAIALYCDGSRNWRYVQCRVGQYPIDELEAWVADVCEGVVTLYGVTLSGNR